ncbi:MAG: V-type ATP synthase subunit I [Planctomycetes bacterium]|nr:V-type ATP synthase subunit I [Planctomycetota bacterium]
MAIAEMKKVMIASHRSEAEDLLDALQQAGIVQILDAERAMVSKEWPELCVESKRPRDLSEMVSRLDKAVTFLKEYATDKDDTSVFRPLVEVDSKKYKEVVSGDSAEKLLVETESVSTAIEQFGTSKENVLGVLAGLEPWKDMTDAVEYLVDFGSTSCITGLLPEQNYEEIVEKLVELCGAIEVVGTRGNMQACIVVCMKEDKGDVQKLLRGGDFEVVSFERMKGTVAELLESRRDELSDIESKLAAANEKSVELARERLSLQIYFDHCQNLLTREDTRTSVPATENTVLLEGWVKKKDYSKLEKLIGKFSASSVSEMEIAEGEEVPVEIDNPSAVRPFEAITRLYGMPSAKDVDPTVFLAPFFALFFGLCLTDAAYGLIMLGLLWWMFKKMQGDKGFLWLFITCAAVTVVAGALTGSWFGNAVVELVGEGSGLDELRKSIMLFDPMEDPMTFFMLSLGLGYFQILCGLVIAFCNNLKNKDYATAIFGQLTWLIFLNSLLIFGLSKGGLIPAVFGKPCAILAIIQAVLIFLFTERKSGMAGRIGGGVFALFGAVFYFGDILSYVRLMALGMVTAGLGMAVNILVKLVMEVPYVGFILGALLFVVGHLFNLAMSTLSSFVHSLRLQFVEFFPKFLEGGGKDFVPLKKNYKHVLVNTKKDN